MSADELSKTTSSGSDSSPSTNEVSQVCFSEILNSNLLFVVQQYILAFSIFKSLMFLTQREHKLMLLTLQKKKKKDKKQAVAHHISWPD